MTHDLFTIHPFLTAGNQHGHPAPLGPTRTAGWPGDATAAGLGPPPGAGEPRAEPATTSRIPARSPRLPGRWARRGGRQPSTLTRSRAAAPPPARSSEPAAPGRPGLRPELRAAPPDPDPAHHVQPGRSGLDASFLLTTCGASRYHHPPIDTIPRACDRRDCRSHFMERCGGCVFLRGVSLRVVLVMR